MTVKELIDELNDLPMDLPVLIETSNDHLVVSDVIGVDEVNDSVILWRTYALCDRKSCIC